MVELMGIEPTTPCLQSRCSSQLSYSPEASRRDADHRRAMRHDVGMPIAPPPWPTGLTP